MKPIRLAHLWHTRELTNPAEIQRLQAQGWVVVPEAKPVRPGTRSQRAYVQRRQDQGFRRVDVLLDPRAFTALQAQRRRGETLASVIERLVLSTCDSAQAGQDHADE